MQLAILGGDPEVDVRTMPDYLQARHGWTRRSGSSITRVIYAPFAGIVTQVETVQPGMYLAASTAAFGLVSTDNVWVEANPKETELTYVKPGDPVDVTVDTYPGRTWKGEVESIAPNSGSEFSVLPAQNTSGNWVKVVQRIPVRITVERKDGDPELRAGMSVVADIDTGHRRTLARPVLDDASHGCGSRMIEVPLPPDHHAVHGRRDADAGAGSDHRQRRAALYAGQPVGDATTRSPGC